MDRVYKHLKSYAFTFLFLMIAFVGTYAMADAASVESPSDFFAQVLQAIQGFGGLPMMGKIASAVLLIIASMKVTILNQLIWSKLGNLQAWVAPVLGLAAGLLTWASGGSVSAASLFAFVASGALAIPLHELLDSVKVIPGIGTMYVALINMIESLPGIGSGGAPPAV